MPELTTEGVHASGSAGSAGEDAGSRRFGLHLAAAALLGFRATLAQHDLLRVCVRLRRLAARLERLPRDDAVNLNEDRLKGEIDVCGVERGGFDESEVVGFCEALGIVGEHGLQVLEIALVAHQHDDDRGVRVRSQFLEPGGEKKNIERETKQRRRRRGLLARVRKKEESGEMHHKKCDGRVRVSSQFLENNKHLLTRRKSLKQRQKSLKINKHLLKRRKSLKQRQKTNKHLLRRAKYLKQRQKITKAENTQTSIKESKILETKAENKQTSIKEKKILETKAENKQAIP